MLRDRFLWMTGGFVLGVAITFSDFVDKSLLSAVLSGICLSVGFGVGFALLNLHFHLVVTGQHQVQVHTPMYIEECTCQDPSQKFCGLCDPRVLMNLARKIPNPCLMTQLGLELGVNADTTETCRNNNSDINQAAFDILYHKWYKSLLIQKGSEYDWKSELKQALVNVGQGNLIRTIVER